MKALSVSPLRMTAWIAATLVVAGLVHLVSILAMPRVATNNSFIRLAGQTPTNQLALLAPVEPGSELLPFEDPATALAACRYDLSRGPVRLRGQLAPEELMLISFHGRDGHTYYAMTDRSALRGRMDVVIATRDQLDEIEAKDNEDELPQELRLEAPHQQGFVLLRALAQRPALMAETRERLQAVACDAR